MSKTRSKRYTTPWPIVALAIVGLLPQTVTGAGPNTAPAEVPPATAHDICQHNCTLQMTPCTQANPYARDPQSQASVQYVVNCLTREQACAKGCPQ
jgi:hypothetical protein